jgi:dihydrofolate reductase
VDAELVDELRIDIMPVFLGAGRRFLDNASLTDSAPGTRAQSAWSAWAEHHDTVRRWTAGL